MNTRLSPVVGCTNPSRTACSHCRFSPSRAASVGSAPYIGSPTQGCLIAAMWTRIWWVRPVSSEISSRVVPTCASQRLVVGDAVPAVGDDGHLVVGGRMPADRRLDRPRERIRMPLDEGVVGLVHRPGSEGAFEHGVGDLTLRDDHQPRGPDIQPLHDALSLRHPGRRDPESRPDQMPEHRRSGPPDARMRRDADRLVDHDDVVVVVADRQPLDLGSGTTTAARGSSSSSTSSIAPAGARSDLATSWPSSRTCPRPIRSADRCRDRPSIRAMAVSTRSPSSPSGTSTTLSSLTLPRRPAAGRRLRSLVSAPVLRSATPLAFAAEADALDHRQDHDQGTAAPVMHMSATLKIGQ